MSVRTRGEERGAGDWGLGAGSRGWGSGAGKIGCREGSRLPKVNHFRDLMVWQGGMDLVECVYRISASFPRTETYGLTGQIRRAAVSVPSNIAEGHSRASTREYLNHLSIAKASLAEVETQ